MANITGYLAKTVGVAGLGAVGYDSHKAGLRESSKFAKDEKVDSLIHEGEMLSLLRVDPIASRYSVPLICMNATEPYLILKYYGYELIAENVCVLFTSISSDPIPFEDCQRGLQYIMEHADDLNVDVRRMVFAGDSAGANLAAHLGQNFYQN